MQNFAIFFLWALAACVLQGSFAEDQSGYICLIEESKQNQCDSICLTELSPRLNEVVKAQNQGNTIKAKLEDSLIAVQNNIKNQLQTVVNQLQLVQNKTDAVEVKSQLQAKLNTTAVPQQAAKAGVPASSTITIPSGFNLFGNRYFRIVYEYTNWETAERKCREMGGYLASFRNEDEINAIISNLANWSNWLGINDREIEGHFVSVASHKPLPFLKWGMGQPNDKNHEENCVFLEDGRMWDFSCNYLLFYICQADNET